MYLFSSFKLLLKKKMKINTISNQKILFEHLFQNVGWFCPAVNAFQKKCLVRCRLHQMCFQVEFVKKNSYMFALEQWTFFNRIIKIYRDEDLADLDFYFNEEIIVALSGEISCWKNLFDLNKIIYFRK